MQVGWFMIGEDIEFYEWIGKMDMQVVCVAEIKHSFKNNKSVVLCMSHWCSKMEMWLFWWRKSLPWVYGKSDVQQWMPPLWALSTRAGKPCKQWHMYMTLSHEIHSYDWHFLWATDDQHMAHILRPSINKTPFWISLKTFFVCDFRFFKRWIVRSPWLS